MAQHTRVRQVGTLDHVANVVVVDGDEAAPLVHGWGVEKGDGSHLELTVSRLLSFHSVRNLHAVRQSLARSSPNIEWVVDSHSAKRGKNWRVWAGGQAYRC
jgi:hypothetical protein